MIGGPPPKTLGGVTLNCAMLRQPSRGLVGSGGANTLNVVLSRVSLAMERRIGSDGVADRIGSLGVALNTASPNRFLPTESSALTRPAFTLVAYGAPATAAI